MRVPGIILLMAVTLVSVRTAAAADQSVAAASGGVAYPPAAAPFLLPPCRDSFWGSVLLRCAPRPEVVVPADDVVLQNQIRGLRPPSRKPYIQVFTW